MNDYFLMAFTENAPALLHLGVEYCKNVTSGGILAIVPRLQEILSLQLTYNGGMVAHRYIGDVVTDEVLMSIGFNCKSIEWLAVRDSRCTDDGVSHLHQCSKLKHLDCIDCTNVSGAGFVPIFKGCPDIEFIEYKFDENTLVELTTNCRHLKHLRIYDNVSRNVLQSVMHNCNEIEGFHFHNAHLDDSVLVEIATNCVKLRSFRCHNPTSNDDCNTMTASGILSLLDQCPMLRDVRLDNCCMLSEASKNQI